MKTNKKYAAVYLGSKRGNSPVFERVASDVAKLLVEKNFGIVYGGANVGTMKVLADSALEFGGEVIGVFPVGFSGKKESIEAKVEVEKKDLTKSIPVKDLAERKQVMEKLSDICIVLPGSLGTLDELSEYALGNQLNFHKKPVFMLDINGYYKPLKDQLNNMIEYGFMNADDARLFKWCTDIESLSLKLDNLE